MVIAVHRAAVLNSLKIVYNDVQASLLEGGDEVIAVDDLSHGSYANLAHLKREPRFVFREHDVVQAFRADVTSIAASRIACSPSTRTTARSCAPRCLL